MFRISRTEINYHSYDNCASENMKIYPKPSNTYGVLFKKHFIVYILLYLSPRDKSPLGNRAKQCEILSAISINTIKLSSSKPQ